MFAARYFAPRYFARRYWPKIGAAGGPPPPVDPVFSKRRRMTQLGAVS
jgi:hypothetical protein